MTGIAEALVFVLTHIHFLIIGVAGGIIVGAIPGLSGSTGIILMLPFLIYIDPSAALIMMSGLFCGSMFGGSIAAVLISTPGTPSAAATVLDGYPLTKKGQKRARPGRPWAWPWSPPRPAASYPPSASFF